MFNASETDHRPSYEEETPVSLSQGEEETNPWGFILQGVGSVFIDTNSEGHMAHIVARVDSDPLPTGEDAPSYKAICGVWGFGYGMGGVNPSIFIASDKKNVNPEERNVCPTCFHADSSDE